MASSKGDRVVAERLPDLGGWEFYLFSFDEGMDTVCKVSLRAGGAEGVEYAVFRGEDGEPSAAGVLPQPGGWSDEAREGVLKQLLTIYAARLPELRAGVVFDLYGEREPLEDDVEEEDEADEEDASDDDDDSDG